MKKNVPTALQPPLPPDGPDEASEPACQTNAAPSSPAGYRTDMELLRDYFRLVECRRGEFNRRPEIRRGAKSVEEVTDPREMERTILAGIAKSRPSAQGSYLLSKFKSFRLTPEEKLLVAALCYFESNLESHGGMHDAIEVVCGRDPIRYMEFRKFMSRRSLLVKSGLLEIRQDRSPYNLGRTANVKLSQELQSSLWGGRLPFSGDIQEEKDAPDKAGRGKKASGKLKLDSPREIYNEISRFVVGQEEAKQSMAVAVYNHYQRINGLKGVEKANVLICGPTGCGKTFLAQNVARILDVPFYAADATQYSETGYVGNNVGDIFTELFRAAGEDPVRAARGIVYLDEVDKIAARYAIGGHNTNRDVSGQAVQEELLRAVEGGDFPGRSFDTGNVLFIAGGAFSGMTLKRAKSCESSNIGFGREPACRCQNQPAKPALNDFVNFGMLPEFMGRFQVRLFLDNLDQESLKKILVETEGSIVSQYTRLFRANGIDLKFEESALDLIAERAEALNTGARSLKSVVEQALNPLMFKHFGKGAGKRELVITADML
jgi:ATP-dependent Clp protease ATP-binding subunit ClpX